MLEKKCFKCGETKPLTEFYKHPQMSDGHVNKCKECNKKDVHENREKKSPYYKAYDRNRPNKEERNKANLARQKTSEGKQAHDKNNKEWADRNPKRRSAQYAVSNAVRDGKLDKLPCFVCGELEVEGHHPNYDAPLDVVWLCVKHHKEVHRRYDAEEDARILSEAKKAPF